MTSQKTVAEETRALKGEANRSISFNKHSLQLQLHSSLHGFHDYDVCILICYVIGLFNRLRPNHRHNGKECCSVVSSRFFGGSVA